MQMCINNTMENLAIFTIVTGGGGGGGKTKAA